VAGAVRARRGRADLTTGVSAGVVGAAFDVRDVFFETT
jgi:hypothetical protein